MKSRSQFNVRIDAELCRAVRLVCAELHWKQGEIGEIAIASLLGSRDRIVAAKKKKAAYACRKLGINIPE